MYAFLNHKKSILCYGYDQVINLKLIQIIIISNKLVEI